MRSQGEHWSLKQPPKQRQPDQFLAVAISTLLAWALIFAAVGLAVLSFRWMIGVI